MTSSTLIPMRSADSPEDYKRLGLKKGRVEPWEDGIHSDGSSGNYEWWYVDVQMTDGSILAVFFFIKPWGIVDSPLDPYVFVTLSLPDGTYIKKDAHFPASEFSAAKGKSDVHIGPNFYTGDLHDYQVHVELDDFVADIELTGTVPAARIGTGYTYAGGHDEDFVTWLIPVPDGNARVIVRGKGLDLKGEGAAYIDRGWNNVPIVKLYHDWFWGRARMGDYHVNTGFNQIQKDYGAPKAAVMMLTHSGKNLIADPSKATCVASDIYTDAQTGKPMAKKLVYDYRDGQTRYTVTFEYEKDLGTVKFIDSLIGAAADNWRATNPDGALVRVRATATIEVYEGEKLVDTQQGNTFYERMYPGKTW